MKRIIIILAFLVCGISSAQQYFFNGTVYVPKTTVQINAIVSPPEGRVEANSDTGSLWYFDGAIWKDTFVGVSSFADLEGDPYDNVPLSDALNSKANDSEVVKINPNSLVSPLTLAVSDSTTIASGIFTINDVVIDTTTRTPGGDNYLTGVDLAGDVLTLTMNYGSPFQVSGFNSGSSLLSTNNIWTGTNSFTKPVSIGTGASPFNLQNVDAILPGDLLEANKNTVIVSGGDPTGQATLNFNPSGTLRPLTATNADIRYNGISLLPRSGATGTFTSQDGKTITVTNGLITNISTP